MAIPNNYIDKIKDKDSGESRPICPPADHVSVDNENYEGETLDEVLNEVSQAIEEAGQGGYAPPAGGIPKTDLAQSVQDSLDKADSALQDEDVAEVARTGDYDDLLNKPTIPDTSGLATKTELQQGLAAKQDKLLAGNGITIGNDGKTVSVDAEVVQPVQADGTFSIRIGNNTYTVNLNHTHENMAKIVKCTEATLPQTLDNDTIYVQVDNATTPSEIESLWLFGLEFTGGGLPTGVPQISKPTPNSTINLGTAYGQGGATGTVKIKGRSLTANSTVVVSVGSGFSLSYGQQSGSSINIDAADVILGCDVTVYATAYGTSGTILITSQTDSLSVEANLTSDVFEDLTGVKFTGYQWVETDYYPNTNTEFEMDLKLTANANTPATPSDCGIAIMRCFYDTSSSDERFTVHVGRSSSSEPYGAYIIFFQNKSGLTNLKQIDFKNLRSEFVADHAKLSYVKGASAGTFKFNGGAERSLTTDLADVNMTTKLDIGYNPVVSQIFAAFDLTIYEFTITENGSVVRHWVPKSKNGIPGLYDTVNHTFISSKTSAELVAVN